MKLAVICVLAIIGIQFISAITIVGILPKLTKALLRISKDNYKQPINLKKLDLGKVMKILQTDSPPLLEAGSAFDKTADQIDKLLDTIKSVKRNDRRHHVFRDVSGRFMSRVKRAVKKLSALFHKHGDALNTYVNELRRGVNPYTVTPNGYLKLPLKDVQRHEGLEQKLESMDFDISNRIHDLSNDINDLKRDFARAHLRTKIPLKLITSIGPLLDTMSDAYNQVGKDAAQLVAKLKSIKSIFKKTKKGTCIFIPLDKFVRNFSNSIKTIGQTYQSIADLGQQVNIRLVTLRNALQRL